MFKVGDRVKKVVDDGNQAPLGATGVIVDMSYHEDGVHHCDLFISRLVNLSVQTLTSRILLEMGAWRTCSDFQKFNETFPDGMDLTVENIRKAAEDGLPINWLLEKLSLMSKKHEVDRVVEKATTGIHFAIHEALLYPAIIEALAGKVGPQETEGMEDGFGWKWTEHVPDCVSCKLNEVNRKFLQRIGKYMSPCNKCWALGGDHHRSFFQPKDKPEPKQPECEFKVGDRVEAVDPSGSPLARQGMKCTVTGIGPFDPVHVRVKSDDGEEFGMYAKRFRLLTPEPELLKVGQRVEAIKDGPTVNSLVVTYRKGWTGAIEEVDDKKYQGHAFCKVDFDKHGIKLCVDMTDLRPIKEAKQHEPWHKRSEKGCRNHDCHRCRYETFANNAAPCSNCGTNMCVFDKTRCYFQRRKDV
ncbi:MAG: hypothetical protein ABIH23_18400 [bacterium]